LRKTLPIPIASRVFPALSCTNCKVFGLILKSLIYFELIQVQGDRHGSGFNFLQADNHLSQQHFIKRPSFLHCMFLTAFVKNKMGIVVWFHIQVLYFVPLVFISVFVPVPCCLYCYGSVV
jgi:prepilin-type processing-associated H-X9-DG protein